LKSFAFDFTFFKKKKQKQKIKNLIIIHTFTGGVIVDGLLNARIVSFKILVE
jgi:uncharacterized membrane protein YoaK (UPF0700 family)